MTMPVLTEFKCPCCGGAIAFDSGLQRMKCPYCDTEFDVDTLKNFEKADQSDRQDDMNWSGAVEGEQWDDEMNVYICKSCGGEIASDENTAATSCPFCGNPVVMNGRLSGVLKPDYIIPFKLDKKAAKAALFNHFKGKRLLPKVFKDENHIDEVKGIYVPFWLFGCDVDADIRYRATRTRVWSDSKYNYTETSHFLVSRAGNIGFERVPVDGSTKMADDMMESLEPFDFADSVEFNKAYLAGYFADKYDVTADMTVNRANERVKHSTEQAFANTVHGFDSVIPESSRIQIHNGTAKYALYPVWLLNTSWNGTNYTFAMNGQTGKLVGNLPLDRGAYWRWFAAVCGIATAVLGGIMALITLL